MAEIHVQPKKQASSNLWIWIVVVLILAAVVYYLVTRNRTAETTTPPANTTGYISLTVSNNKSILSDRDQSRVSAVPTSDFVQPKALLS